MNNTRTLALLAVLTAATLVVGTLAATTIATQSAFAGGKKDKEDKFMKMKEKDKQDTTYKKGPLRQDDNNNNKARDNGYNKDDGSGGNDNGNTVTIQVNKQKGKQSGWDNTQSQEAQNVICTHPGNNAICSQEGVAAPTPPQPIPTIQVSGQGEGENLCPLPATVSNPASITFSVREFAGGVQGQFTMIVHVAPNEDRNKIGTLNSVQISGGSFTVTGTELTSPCDDSRVPTSVIISGQCGTGVTIQYATADRERATFTGNVACTTT